MLDLFVKNKCRKDIKLAQKRGKDLNKLKLVIDKLQVGQPLEAKYKPHALVGEYADCWECHIDPTGFLFILLRMAS